MTTGLSRTSEGMRIYEPDGQVLRDFLKDRSHVSIIRGPLGSGTSTACCMKIYSLALEQNPSPEDGIRRSRWCVVRDSYPNLRNTTIRTWLDWFPQEQYGRFLWTRPAIHEIRIGNVELDVIFLSVDNEEDVAKLRSFDFTGIWFNELEYMKFLLFMEAESRTGRFPAVKDGGPTWHGVIADMNAPDETHWVPKLTGEVVIEDDDENPEVVRQGLPFDWSYFVQPPALLELRDATGREITGYKLNPQAENSKWLVDGYYEEKCRGKTKAWIDSRLRNQITFVLDGLAVFKGFNPDTHIAPEPLKPVEGHDVIVGLDFGFNRPAAVCMQTIDGRIFIQHEFRRYGTAATSFAPELKRFLERTYPGCQYQIFGDPKGQDRGQADGRTSYEVYKACGLIVTPAPVPTNAPQTRIAAVDSVLSQMKDGKPRFVMSPTGCPTLKAAMCGRYHIKKNALGDPDPVKDKYSDIADALQYAMLGLGEGRIMIGLEPLAKARAMKVSRESGFKMNARRVA